ncbi:MAG: xylulokinase [Clostridia bacterium]|nr:xylulokinase [Clostridia bacterium]
MSYYIGIDLGTSAVKMLMTDENGEIIKSVSKEYPLYFPHEGWSEQKPEDWWSAVKEGLKELTDGSDKSLAKGISFGGQMHGLVILDENDNVIRPAILWNDGRTQSEVDYLNNEIGKHKLSEYTANIAFAGFTAPKILWLKKNEPENFKRIKKIMLPKDYIAYMLTGVHSTDYSDASGMLLLDVKNKKWSQEMLDICGVDESVMPKLFESYEVTGTLKSELAEELGLNGDTKVIAGAGDNAAAAIGTGTVKHGQCNISLGTSGTVFISQDTFSVDDNNALHSFAHANGKYHLMGCMLSAASCNKWWLEEILKTNDYIGSQKDIKELGENNVFFLPYLMGERSPHNDPNVRGAFIGMSMDTTQSDMTQAVLEGVAFGLRDSVEVARSLGMEITRSTICGGGAKSPLWRNIVANVMNMEIVTLKKEEGPAMGGAILAMVGCGEYSDVYEAAEKLVKYDRVYSPDPELVGKYEIKYKEFNHLYPTVKDLFN